MSIRIFATAAIGLAAGLAAPAAAQDAAAPCGVTDAARLDAVARGLEGAWVSDFKAGYVVMGPMVMPHGAAPAPETGRLEMRDGRLTIVPDGADGMDFTLDWETGVDWSFDRQPSLPGGGVAANVPELEIDDDDIAVLAGCPVNDLPRLVGAASLPVDGGTMTMTVRLVVVSDDLVYGFQQVHGVARGQTVVERRPFVMSR